MKDTRNLIKQYYGIRAILDEIKDEVEELKQFQ
jgi:hypothetical protein